MKKFGPCKILKKFNNGHAFEVELLDDIDILSIFNILDIYEYYEYDKEIIDHPNYTKKKT